MGAFNGFIVILTLYAVSYGTVLGVRTSVESAKSQPPSPARSLRRTLWTSMKAAAVCTAVALASIGVWNWIFSRDVCTSGVWGCLPIGPVVILIGMPLAMVLAALGLRLAQAPRPWLVALSTTVTLLVLINLPFDAVTSSVSTPLAAGAYTAVTAAAWTWIFDSVTPAHMPVVAILIILIAAVGGEALQNQQRRTAENDRIAATGARPLLLQDPAWDYVDYITTSNRLTVIYDKRDDQSRRIAIDIVRAPNDVDPTVNCSAATADLVDAPTPEPTCEPLGGQLWRLRQGLLITHLARVDGMLVRVHALYDHTLTDAEARTLLGQLQEASASDL